MVEASKVGETINIYDYLMAALGTRAKIDVIPKAAADVLARNVPCLLVSNHAYPPFDGLITLSLMQRYRSQIGIMVNSNNSLLRTFPEYSLNTIPLHMQGGLLGCRDKDEVRRSQISAMKRTIRELNESACVAVFSAGQGSKAARSGDPIIDLPWLSGVGQIVSHFGRHGRHLEIIPVHVVGHMGTEANSRRYQWAAIELPTWLPAALQLATRLGVQSQPLVPSAIRFSSHVTNGAWTGMISKYRGDRSETRSVRHLRAKAGRLWVGQLWKFGRPNTATHALSFNSRSGSFHRRDLASSYFVFVPTTE